MLMMILSILRLEYEADNCEQCRAWLNTHIDKHFLNAILYMSKRCSLCTQAFVYVGCFVSPSLYQVECFIFMRDLAISCSFEAEK